MTKLGQPSMVMPSREGQNRIERRTRNRVLSCGSFEFGFRTIATSTLCKKTFCKLDYFLALFFVREF